VPGTFLSAWHFSALFARSGKIPVGHGQPCLGLPGNWRVLRGGSWNNNRLAARAVYRNNNTPDNRNNNVGWRVVVRRSTPHLLSSEADGSPVLFPRRSHAPAWPAGDGAGPGGGPPIGRRLQFMPADHGLQDAVREVDEMAQASPVCPAFGRHGAPPPAGAYKSLDAAWIRSRRARSTGVGQPGRLPYPPTKCQALS
jgi:hypothetical protein